MAYVAPLGDALDFANGSGATYVAPNGDAVDFSANTSGGAAIPFVRASALGSIKVVGVGFGVYSAASQARFGQASGKVRVKGLCRGAHGVAGNASGVIKPHPAPLTGARTVPHLNSKTGAVESLTTNPPCFHV